MLQRSPRCAARCVASPPARILEMENKMLDKENIAIRN